MRKTLLVPMAATMLVTGCSFDLDLGGDWSGFGGIGPCCAPGIMMNPSTTDLLKGDTISLSTIFFPPGADSTTWSVGDSSFRIARMTATRDTMIAVAERRGSALVMASRGVTTASLMLFAYDSSDVTAVRITYPYPGMSVRLVTPELAAGAQLLVGSRVLGSRLPTWSSSDTAKAAVVVTLSNLLFDPRPRPVIVPRATGQVYIIAAWGTLRDSVSLTISP